MGVRNGVSDLVVVLSNRVLFIEMKDGNNDQSESQIDFENVATKLNHQYHIIRSLEQFKNLIQNELSLQ